MRGLIQLSDREKYALLELSYVDLPAAMQAHLPITLGRWADQARPLPERRALWETIRGNPVLRALKITAYENDNPSEKPGGSGFVGYALADACANAAALFRGSESDTLRNTLADWGSNVAAALGLTIRQQRQADMFYRDHLHAAGGIRLVMGHSKGGNLAAYVYSQHLRDDPVAYIVNGQPIYWLHLNPRQRQALRGERFQFVVHEGDLVSTLGFVDYIKRIVALRADIPRGTFSAHSLSSACFDETGSLITLHTGATAPRVLLSAAATSLQAVIASWPEEENPALVLLVDMAITAGVLALDYSYRNLHQSARSGADDFAMQVKGESLGPALVGWLDRLMLSCDNMQLAARRVAIARADASGLPPPAHFGQARNMQVIRQRLWAVRAQLRRLRAMEPEQAWMFSGAFAHVESALHAQEQAIKTLRRGEIYAKRLL